MDRLTTGMGPFRATRLWNEIVNDFRSGIPSKRHRWKMRFYDNCFLSTEAVDWMHDYLQNNENYGPWVTREQSIQLLDKFVQRKVIESAKPYKGVTKDTFEDNGCPYKLVHLSPIKKIRGALQSRNNLKTLTPLPKKTRSRAPMRPLFLNTNLREENQSRDMIKGKLNFNGSNEELTAVGPSQRKRQSKPGFLQRSRSLSEVDKQEPKSSFYVPGEGTGVSCTFTKDDSYPDEKAEAVWKNCTLARLKSLLSLFTLEDIVDETAIKGSHIIHNSTQLSKTGVVLVTDRDHDLPQWVLSAMKCIANWPQKQESDLPDYPGFEKDVFQTISMYFHNLTEPLMTFELYDLIVQAYELGKKREIRMNPQEASPADCSLLQRQPDKLLQQNHSASGKTVQRSPSMMHHSSHQGRVFCITRSRNVRLPSNQCLDSKRAPVSMGSHQGHAKQQSGVGRAQSMRVNTASVKQSSIFPEGSDFLKNGRPRSFAGYSDKQDAESMPDTALLETRDNSSQKERISYQNTSKSSGVNRHAGKFIRNDKRSLRLSKRFGSASDLISRLIKRKGSKGNGSVPDISSTIQEENESNENAMSRAQPVPLTSTVSLSNKSSQSDACRNREAISPPYLAPPRATHSFSEIMTSAQGGKTYTVYPQDNESSVSGDKFLQGKSASSVELRVSPPEAISTPKKEVVQTKYSESLESYCEEAMRLILLFLPPSNRRKLHLLMKMMYKVTQNEELQLGDINKRDLVLKTFSPSILRRVTEVDYDEVYANRIVAYFLDNFNNILAPSATLKMSVEQKLRKETQLQSNSACGSSITYCKQLTREEYKDVSQSSSLKALEDLLETIIEDQNMDAKEKKKRLKLFQQAYPEIYKKHLPFAANAAMFPARPKIKQPMLKRSLTRLKPIR